MIGVKTVNRNRKRRRVTSDVYLLLTALVAYVTFTILEYVGFFNVNSTSSNKPLLVLGHAIMYAITFPVVIAIFIALIAIF
ncbi:MAG: hypothetical protein QXT84_06195, partial [Candidatus Bathyarchaeia archaeon]